MVKFQAHCHSLKAGPDLLHKLWLWHTAAQGVSNQHSWDLIISVYKYNGTKLPMDKDVPFNKCNLSCIAIQGNNCIAWPPQKVIDAPIGPHLASRKGQQCLDLFIDLKAPDKVQGHMYSQQQHPCPVLDTGLKHALTEEEGSTDLFQHHLYICGLDPTSFPVLKHLPDLADKLVQLLFGHVNLLDLLRFDQQHKKYMCKFDHSRKHKA